MMAGIIGALIGGSATFISVFIAFSLQQQGLEQQQLTEQQNIANAAYIDVSGIENRFNRAISRFNASELKEPNSFEFTTIQFYRDDGLYYILGKDLSRLNRTLSADLYKFYNQVVEIENKRAVISSIIEKQIRGENITQYDVIIAHTFSKGVYEERIPHCIKLAEKIKRELNEEYDINYTSPPATMLDNQTETFYLQGGQIHVSAI